ncbi:unnamed protein product [Ectocarpus sp. 4 AP-2014]
MHAFCVLLLLRCAALGGAFAPSLLPSASTSSLWRRDASGHVVSASGAWCPSPWSSESCAWSGSRRILSISREMRVCGHADDEGRDYTRAKLADPSAIIAETEAKIEAIAEEIRVVEGKAEVTEKKIETIEAALSGGAAYLGTTDISEVLVKEHLQLEDERSKLWEEEMRLRDKKLLLGWTNVFRMKELTTAGLVSPSGSESPAPSIGEEIEAVEEETRAAERKVAAVQEEIEAVQKDIEAFGPAVEWGGLSETEKDNWMKWMQLGDKKERLREDRWWICKEQEHVRQKKLLLLNKLPTTAGSVSPSGTRCLGLAHVGIHRTSGAYPHRSTCLCYELPADLSNRLGRSDCLFTGSEPSTPSVGNRVGEEIAAVRKEIRVVEEKIDAVQEKIVAVESAIAEGGAYDGITCSNSLGVEISVFHDYHKRPLWLDKKWLWEKELLVLNKLPPTADSVSPSAANRFEDFGAALPGAVVVNNTLELANDTFFFGTPSLGSKLFIRPCYKDLAELILGGDSSYIAVTGTPGIGKSMFGYYLLYLLRCQGKTVVFQVKRAWYRFSDAGVIKGDYKDFLRAGFLFRNGHDCDSWFLCDPDDRPREMLPGTTVVWASPKKGTVHEFMKQPSAVQYFMPVWSQDELLECRRAVFNHVEGIDVERAFGVVGGVAGAVFDKESLRQIKEGMETYVVGVDVPLLRAAGWLPWARDFVDDIAEALFHVFPGVNNTYKDYTIRLGSDFAEELIVEQVAKNDARTSFQFSRKLGAYPDIRELLDERIFRRFS